MKEFKAYESKTVNASIGAWYGFLTILSYNNKFYIAVQNIDLGRYDWVEIKKTYYNQTLKCKALKMRKVLVGTRTYKLIEESIKGL